MIIIEVKVRRTVSDHEKTAHEYQLLSYMLSYSAHVAREKKRLERPCGYLLYVTSSPKGAERMKFDDREIVLVQGQSNTLFDIFLPLYLEPSSENIERAISVIEELVEAVKKYGGHLASNYAKSALNLLLSATDVLLALVREELEMLWRFLPRDPRVLKELYEAGVLTQEEFEKIKQEILKELERVFRRPFQRVHKGRAHTCRPSFPSLET